MTKATIACEFSRFYIGHMQSRSFLLRTLLLVIVAALSGNRPAPEWQGFSHQSLGITAECAARVLNQFGYVVREDGPKPEGGSIRLMLHTSPVANHSPLILTAYFEGNLRFSSVFMDASDHRVADAVWQGFKRKCGLS